MVHKHLAKATSRSDTPSGCTALNRETHSPYLSYHRPCYFPSEQVDAKGKVRKRYRRQALHTPYEKLKSLPGASDCLKEGLDFAQLDARA